MALRISDATRSYASEEDGPDGTRTVVAISPDERFELVVVRYWALTSHVDIVRIRSRAGLSSREVNQDLACFAVPFDPVGPEDTFANARFSARQKIEVRTEAGKPWTATFDPHTMLADATVSHGC